jgi:hypothetical protein
MGGPRARLEPVAVRNRPSHGRDAQSVSVESTHKDGSVSESKSFQAVTIFIP